MKVVRLILLSAALSGSLIAQSTVTGKAETKGTCSPATSGSHNSFVIHCGIGEEQGKKIIELLNHALGSKDIATINSKLDELIQVAARPAPVDTLNCTGSNCVQNGNQTNYDQRQFNAQQPPPHLTGLEVKTISPITIDPSKPMMNMDGPLAANPGVSLNFTVDGIFQNPIFLAMCDRPCSATSAHAGGVSSPRMLKSPQDPRIAGAALGLMGPLMPGNPVTINIHSADSQTVTILHVEGYVPPAR
jgi:hypothetical protein